MRVVIAGGGTGGHLMPALAIAEALTVSDASLEAVLVGAQRGVEASILPQRPYRYHLLPFEPIHRKAWWRNVRWPILAWRLVRACNRLLESESPLAVVGTGGYASGPILLQAWRRGIPVALQEQNAYPGVTTRLLARKARQVHLGFPEALQSLRPGPEAAVYTHGNPIAAPPSQRIDPSVIKERLGIACDAPVLLVMGGSQGARSVNRAVGHLVDSGALDDTVLLWSTGRATAAEYSHYHLPPHRVVREFWDPIADAYAVADLVVARAGAMTTAEICAWGLPAIYIPLPSAAADHQTKNASALEADGVAVHLPESSLSPESLGGTLEGLLADATRRNALAQAALARGKPEAARRIASEILSMVS